MVKYSQLDEQQRLEKIFVSIGIKHHKCLEFGAGDGKTYSNTRHFVENMKFDGMFWDVNPRGEGVFKEIVTAENINFLHEKYGMEMYYDLLSIDIDGNDYWVWKELRYQPRVVIIEFNGQIEKNKSVTIEYDTQFKFDSTVYHGASWNALLKLGQEKGYELVDSTALNMIFVLKSEIGKMTFGHLDYTVKRSFPNDKLNRKWIEI